MNKPRILMLGEFPGLSTGYGVYTKELLTRLVATGKYEIAQLASYCFADDPRIGKFPWKIYPNMFRKGDQNDENRYNSNPINQFGAWKFEEVCLDFKPDVVLDIRDNWYSSYVDESPFRKMFKWIWMPTADSYPQSDEWIDLYSRVDKILSYTDFGKNVFEFQSGGKIKVSGVACPAADCAFHLLDNRSESRKAMGFPDDALVFGAVMRNQERKLFPNLFSSFRNFLDKTKRRHSYLYLHTSYPDNNCWNIPHLLKYYKLSSKVLFTYACEECDKNGKPTIFPSFFQDSRTVCPVCLKPNGVLCNVNVGVSNEMLNRIYNSFDYYIQYANRESPGMPLIESASCHIPIIAVDYSGMSSILDSVGGVRLKPLSYLTDIKTNAFAAIPNDTALSATMCMVSQIPEEKRIELGNAVGKLAKEKFNWDNVAKVWQESIDSLDTNRQSWHSPLRIKSIPNDFPQNLKHSDFVQWLIINVIQDEEKLGGYLEMKILRDLNYGGIFGGVSPFHFNDQSIIEQQPRLHKFGKQEAFNVCRNISTKWNNFEMLRGQRLGIN